MDDLNSRILRIPVEKLRITKKGRLDFPIITKLCMGRDCFKKSKTTVGEYSRYEKSEWCKSCLWYLLKRRKLNTPVTTSNDLEWIRRNQKFVVCHIGTVTCYNGAWLKKIDDLQEESYEKMLPDIIRAYEVCR